MWNPETSRVVVEGQVATSVVTSAVFSADGRRLVVTDESGLVRTIDAATLRPIGTPVHVGSNACCVALAAGDQAAVVFSDPAVAKRSLGPSSHSQWNLVDLRSGRLVSSRALGMDALAADASPDGQTVAVTGAGGEMWLLDSKTGKPVSTPPRGDGADNTWVAHSSDGAQVVTGAVDGTIRLWDGASGVLLGTVRLPENTPLVATFLYGGQDLLIASNAGGVYLWNSRLNEATNFACALAGRTLTRTEWRAFTDRPYRPRCPKLPGLPPDLS